MVVPRFGGNAAVQHEVGVQRSASIHPHRHCAQASSARLAWDIINARAHGRLGMVMSYFRMMSGKRKTFPPRSFAMFHRIHLAAILALGVGATPALAQQSTLEGAQQQAVEGIAKLLQALQLFVKSVPQFEAPEVLPNGDIIIRRIHPENAPAPTPPKDDRDSTST
jgi:hypothetical protein